MLGMLELVLYWLGSLVKSRHRLEAENLALRHQVNILRRRVSRRLWLSNADRLAFVWLYRLCPSMLDAVAIIRPETVIRWHRQGFKGWSQRVAVATPGQPMDRACWWRAALRGDVRADGSHGSRAPPGRPA